MVKAESLVLTVIQQMNKYILSWIQHCSLRKLYLKRQRWRCLEEWNSFSSFLESCGASYFSEGRLQTGKGFMKVPFVLSGLWQRDSWDVWIALGWLIPAGTDSPWVNQAFSCFVPIFLYFSVHLWESSLVHICQNKHAWHMLMVVGMVVMLLVRTTLLQLPANTCWLLCFWSDVSGKKNTYIKKKSLLHNLSNFELLRRKKLKLFLWF